MSLRPGQWKRREAAGAEHLPSGGTGTITAEMRFSAIVLLSALAGYVAAWSAALLLDGLDTSTGFGQALLWTAPAIWGVAVAVVVAVRLDVISSLVRGISAAVAAYAGGFLALLTWLAINGTGT